MKLSFGQILANQHHVVEEEYMNIHLLREMFSLYSFHLFPRITILMKVSTFRQGGSSRKIDIGGLNSK